MHCQAKDRLFLRIFDHNIYEASLSETSSDINNVLACFLDHEVVMISRLWSDNVIEPCKIETSKTNINNG